MSSDHFLTCCDVIEESKYNQLLFPCVSMYTVQGEQTNTIIFISMFLQGLKWILILKGLPLLHFIPFYSNQSIVLFIPSMSLKNNFNHEIYLSDLPVLFKDQIYR